MKGEFEKRCYDYQPSLCVHAPEEDENGKITQKVHKTHRLPTREEIKQVIDEARKEFPMKDWEIKSWLSENCNMEYIMEEQAIELAKWFKKYFGDRVFTRA